MSSELLYERIVDELQVRMRDGILQAGDKAPSLASLREEFLVSTITASRALQELEERGYLSRIPGRGYFVSQIQQPTRRKRIRIGCLLRGNYVSLRDHYFNEVINGIQQVASMAKVDLLWTYLSQQLCQLPMGLEEELLQAAMDMKDEVDGYLLDERISDTLAQQILERTRKPAVMVNRTTDLPIPSVASNYRQGLSDLRKTLLQMQYNRFIFTMSDMKVYAILEKQRFIQESIEKYGLNPRHYQILPGITTDPIEKTFERTLQCMERLEPGKTVLISTCDECLGNLMELLLQAGVQIPGELALVATEGMSVTFTTRPRLATMRTDTVQIGQKAMSALLNRLENHTYEPIQNYLIPQSFLLGESL